MTRRASVILIWILALLGILAVVYLLFGKALLARYTGGIPDAAIDYPADTERVLFNPLMGYAPDARYEDEVGESRLVYMEVLWSELEPSEGAFAFDALAKKNHLDRWRLAGKRVVLRFICDKPGDQPHRDIPDWLYQKTGGDGAAYDYEGKRGFSPNYENPVFIEYHRRAVRALGERFGGDLFVAYIELGSLGHWGEWHVRYDAGIPRIPKAEVREEYIAPYLDAFPNAKLMMRRPFNTAADHGFGLYDDMAGHPTDTREWLDWIQNGGDYRQAEEEDALSPMPDAWKSAPIGGEFNSDLSMDWMLRFQLDQTLELLRASHTTFLGPKAPTERDENCGEGAEAVLRTIGYRLRISRAQITHTMFRGQVQVKLTWENDGIAPMYWDWPVELLLIDSAGWAVGRIPVDLRTTQILPGKAIVTTTAFSWKDAYAGAVKLGVAISDPEAGEADVELAMQAERQDKVTILHSW